MLTLAPLPYDFAALEPFIDATTMQLHHDKHHQTYVDKYNAAIQNQPDLQAQSVETLLTDLNKIPESIRTAVKNHGGGVANHNLFWSILAPGNQQPAGQILATIKQNFGSYEKFQELFTAAALGQFGSGWAWLVTDKDHKLEIMALPNQDSPLSIGKYPLLTLDVWEHAYYLQYQNRRPDYVAAFWQVINWAEVEKRWLSVS